MLTGESLPVEKAVGDSVIGARQPSGSFVSRPPRSARHCPRADRCSSKTTRAPRRRCRTLADEISSYFVPSIWRSPRSRLSVVSLSRASITLARQAAIAVSSSPALARRSGDAHSNHGRQRQGR